MFPLTKLKLKMHSIHQSVLHSSWLEVLKKPFFSEHSTLLAQILSIIAPKEKKPFHFEYVISF